MFYFVVINIYICLYFIAYVIVLNKAIIDFFYKYFFVLGASGKILLVRQKSKVPKVVSRYLCAIEQLESSKTAPNRALKGKGGARATRVAPPPSGAGGGESQSKGGPHGPGTTHDTPMQGICKDLVRNIDRQFAHTMLG